MRQALEWIGALEEIKPTTRIAIKPNLTYPYHRPGFTTTPAGLAALIAVLREHTSHIAVVEGDGGYGEPPGSWLAAETFRTHGLERLACEYGVELVSLSLEERELVPVPVHGRLEQIPLPARLLHETDLFISLPVPKIHAMTGLSLGYKNQWGCISDPNRRHWHPIFNEVVVAINRALNPVCLGDGTYFLDRNGPMQGDPVPMNLIVAGTSPGAFDRYVSELMGVPWQRVPHLRHAVQVGDMPAELGQIDYNVSPSSGQVQPFHLRRTLRNRLGLLAFHSPFLTWLGWESWFGRTLVHGILYKMGGRMIVPPESKHSR